MIRNNDFHHCTAINTLFIWSLDWVFTNLRKVLSGSRINSAGFGKTQTRFLDGIRDLTSKFGIRDCPENGAGMRDQDPSSSPCNKHLVSTTLPFNGYITKMYLYSKQTGLAFFLKTPYVSLFRRCRFNVTWTKSADYTRSNNKQRLKQVMIFSLHLGNMLGDQTKPYRILRGKSINRSFCNMIWKWCYIYTQPVYRVLSTQTPKAVYSPSISKKRNKNGGGETSLRG